MKSVRYVLLAYLAILCVAFVDRGQAQGIFPYPNAITDRLVHHETPMAPPPVNSPFADPDFGSMIVRATDETTNTQIPGSYLRNEASGHANMWNSNAKKFYVIGEGGYEFAFGFDGSTMEVKSLPGANAGNGLLLPLRPGSTFSFVDPDLIYGTLNKTRLTISSYRFSTGVTSAVLDTTTCGTQPPLVPSNKVVSNDDVSLAADDMRVSISEGGPEGGKHPFVVVHDQNLGCRWYNTQTGQIGGKWGKIGAATISARYLVDHASLSRSGIYVHIVSNDATWYVWNLATLSVTACPIDGGPDCGGYGADGYNSFVNALGVTDGMNIGKRPFGDLTQITPLVWPLGLQPNFGQAKHFTWSNVNAEDNVPVCGTGYDYEGDTEITEPYDNEIFCIETDGLKSTVWRFAHHRAIWIAPYFNTQPLGNVSDDGRFFLFTSGWDRQLGKDSHGVPRSDVWIVKLN